MPWSEGNNGETKASAKLHPAKNVPAVGSRIRRFDLTISPEPQSASASTTPPVGNAISPHLPSSFALGVAGVRPVLSTVHQAKYGADISVMPRTDECGLASRRGAFFGPFDCLP
ncbi:hypothetical protein [Mesorhizobium australicum]|uniref:hypothetical protein n=1 Tax=Mesorhizobium australicum TaxID=536018 RepID=UPI00333D0DA1